MKLLEAGRARADLSPHGMKSMKILHAALNNHVIQATKIPEQNVPLRTTSSPQQLN